MPGGMSTRLVVFLCLPLIAALTFGCRGPSAGDEPEPPAEKDKVADTARIVCGRDGLHVLTPTVEAQPDGVHIVLDNRLEGKADLTVDHPGGGEG